MAKKQAKQERLVLDPPVGFHFRVQFDDFGNDQDMRFQEVLGLIGCPKLDNTDIYVDKLTAIFRDNDIRSLGVVYMEVPCCTGLVQLAKTAVEQSGKQIPTILYRVGIKGDFVEERALEQPAA